MTGHRMRRECSVECLLSRLRTRTGNVLRKRAGLVTVGDVADRFRDGTLAGVKNFGHAALWEVKRELEAAGLLCPAAGQDEEPQPVKPDRPVDPAKLVNPGGYETRLARIEKKLDALLQIARPE